MKPTSGGPPRFRLSLTLQIVCGIFIGVCLGLLFGPSTKPLGALGMLFIQMIKGVAIPLVFLAVLDAVLTVSFTGRQVRRMFLITGTNAAIAAFIGIGLSGIFTPGAGVRHMTLPADVPAVEFKTPQLGIAAVAEAILPLNPAASFVQGSVIQIVVLALFFGAALRLMGRLEDDEPESAEQAEKMRHAVKTIQLLVSALLAAVSRILHWIVLLVPFAVMGVTASTVGEHGFRAFYPMIAYVLVISGGLILHSLVVYQCWIHFVAGRSLKEFWSAARIAVVHAFATNSSLATLPLTLEALDRLKVPKSASRLGACVGTNFNNDGILLYEAGAALFVAQAMGIDLSLSQQLTVVALSAVAAVGVAGVPEAGIVSLSMVLAAVHLPLEILPLLLTVDWIIARLRSVVNVLSDFTVSIVLGAWEGQDVGLDSERFGVAEL